MQDELAKLKRHVSAQIKGPGRKYPPELRDKLIATIGMLRQGGWSYQAIGDALGLSPSAARGFMRKSRSKTTRPGRPVEVRPVGPGPDPVATTRGPAAEQRPRLCVISPKGWRIEGLDVEQAARLLANLPC